MLYKRTTIVGDDDWGHFIDMDDIQIKQVSHKIVEPYYTTTTTFQLMCETCLRAFEIPRINNSCICSTFVTTCTLGTIMLCFIL